MFYFFTTRKKTHCCRDHINLTLKCKFSDSCTVMAQNSYRLKYNLMFQVCFCVNML